MPQELPWAMAYCYNQDDLFNRWMQGTARFKINSTDVLVLETDKLSFMEIQVPAFLSGFLFHIKQMEPA